MTPRSNRCSPSFARPSCSTAPLSTTWRSCEREEDQAFAVNARAVKRLAARCAAAGAQLVHLSTNYVFDGTGTEPYDEYALPKPRSIYAISKLAGEHAALAYAPGALVVRTAGLYGAARKRVEGRQLRDPDDRPCSRAGRAEGGRGPAAHADLHRRSRERDPGRGRCRRHRDSARHELRRDQLARFHRGDHGAGGCRGAGRGGDHHDRPGCRGSSAERRPAIHRLRACRPADDCGPGARRSPTTWNAPACWPARPSDDQQQPRGTDEASRRLASTGRS